MSEKPIAVILAGIAAVSLCAACALGPVVLGSAVGWAFGWAADLSPMATTGAVIFAALAVFALFRRWSAMRPREDSDAAKLPDSTEREY
jgi:membrane protein implicated in regulation of membrane protease activity